MLIGQYVGSVAEKKQVAFPKKFRDEFGDSLVLTKGIDQNLVVVKKENWETLLEGTDGSPFIRKDIRETQRFLLGNAVEVDLDKKGRFIIPEYLRVHAGIDKEVVFVGVKRFVEIWSKTAWESEQERLSGSISVTTERIGEKENHE